MSFHQDARFWSVLERDAILDFERQTTIATGGVDVLVLNRLAPSLGRPVHIAQSLRGMRAIYVRTGQSLLP